MRRHARFLIWSLLGAGLIWWGSAGAEAAPAATPRVRVRPQYSPGDVRPSLTRPVPLPRPKLQFVGAAAADGVRLRWSVSGMWLSPGGFRLLRRERGQPEFTALAVVRPRSEQQIELRREAGGAPQRVPVRLGDILAKAQLPPELGGPGAVEPEALRSVPQYRITPPPVLSPREGDPARGAEQLRAPVAPEWVEAEQRRLANLTPQESAIQRTQRARSLVLLLSSTNWALAQDLGLAYTDAGVAKGRVYEYRIEMLGADDRPLANYDVEPQPTVAVKAGEDLTPPAPADLTPEPRNGQVGFHWKRPAGKNRDGLDLARTISYYNVYRSDSPTGAETKANRLPVVIAYTPAKDAPGVPARMVEPRVFWVDGKLPGTTPGEGRGTLVNGRQYWYSIEAVDFFGRVSARTPRVVARPFARPLPPLLVTRPEKSVPVPASYLFARSGNPPAWTTGQPASATGGKPSQPGGIAALLHHGGDPAVVQQGAALRPVVRKPDYQDDVRIVWRVPTGSEPGAQPPDVEIASFQVYRQDLAPGSTLTNPGKVDATAREFTDRAPARDRVYRYFVRAIDRWGNGSAPSAALEVPLPDRTPLPTPTVTSVTASRETVDGSEMARVSVRWSCALAANVAGFNLYRAETRWPDEEPGALELCRPAVATQSAEAAPRRLVQMAAAGVVPIPDVKQPLKPGEVALPGAAIQRLPAKLLPRTTAEFIDRVPAEVSRTLHYEIEAVSKFGFRSPRSARNSVRVLGTTGPSAPKALAAVSEPDGGAAEDTHGDITVRWVLAPASERVVSYNVYWARSGGNQVTWRKHNTEPILAPSRPSSGAAAPGAAAAATASLSASALLAAATAGASSGGGTHPVSRVSQIPRIFTAYRHTNSALTPGVEYEYFVEAVDADGLVSARSNAVGVTPAKIRARMPSGVAATGEMDNIRIAWTHRDSEVTGYLLERGLRESGPFRQLCALIGATGVRVATELSHMDRTVLPGVSYHYRVTALDRNGNRSNPVVVGPARCLRGALAAPTGALTGADAVVGQPVATPAPSSAATPTNGAGGTVSGRVTFGGQAPAQLAGETITITLVPAAGPPITRSLTGSAGDFRFEAVAAGPITLRVMRGTQTRTAMFPLGQDEQRQINLEYSALTPGP